MPRQKQKQMQSRGRAGPCLESSPEPSSLFTSLQLVRTAAEVSVLDGMSVTPGFLPLGLGQSAALTFPVCPKTLDPS